MRPSILISTLFGLSGLTLAVPVGHKLETPAVSLHKREPEPDTAVVPLFKREANESKKKPGKVVSVYKREPVVEDTAGSVVSVY
ncbi:MAG: hypothetical protein Q9182_003822 [Xanthomendoza sp. 2 TL-2023]